MPKVQGLFYKVCKSVKVNTRDYRFQLVTQDDNIAKPQLQGVNDIESKMP